MSFLDNLLGNVVGDGGAQQGVAEAVMGLINNPNIGGLPGLVQRLQQAGLGDAVASWMSTGQNQAVSAGQIQQALGSDQIQQIASSLGISPEVASGAVAQLLPQVIDQLTPNGSVPEGGMLEQGLALLKSKLLG